jgi:hypothetical protein
VAERCGFNGRNPVTGLLGQCDNAAARIVIVAVSKPQFPKLRNYGVATRVCDWHAVDLITHYGAVVPAPGELEEVRT